MIDFDFFHLSTRERNHQNQSSSQNQPLSLYAHALLFVHSSSRLTFIRELLARLFAELKML